MGGRCCGLGIADGPPEKAEITPAIALVVRPAGELARAGLVPQSNRTLADHHREHQATALVSPLASPRVRTLGSASARSLPGAPQDARSFGHPRTMEKRRARFKT